MKIRILPQEIATQIVFLLIISAIIFQLCISAAFLIGRGYFHAQEAAGENRFIHLIADFMNVTSTLPAVTRDKMIDWLQAENPQLDIKREAPPEEASKFRQDDALIETVRSRAGAHVRVFGIGELGEFERLGFRFDDGAYVTIEVRHGPVPSDFEQPHQPPHGPPGAPAAGSPPPLNDFDPRMPPPPSPMIPLVFGTLLFFAISFTIFLIWAAHALTRPLRKFADAVDEFSVNGTMTLFAENGPSELRGAERALNRMRERVRTMIEQRTQTLAAISHDLRTPITRLRLRAEFIDPSEVREPILRDIEQMDAMVHSALSFIRDGMEVQRNTLLDLGALLQTICDEFADVGYNVSLESAAPISIKGNVEELYRAVTNLVSNAVKFGAEVSVHLRRAAADSIEIDIVDDGPGIPEESKEAMLAPFIRGDESRKSEGLQGFGLGLPIVQSIVTAHRGFLHLLDRKPHGLIARITLPCG